VADYAFGQMRLTKLKGDPPALEIRVVLRNCIRPSDDRGSTAE
jgi:hypothetical protein